MRKIRCWWFGCKEEDPEDMLAPPGYKDCVRCGECVEYGDLVGDTRHNRVKGLLRYWLWRHWVPEPCIECGKRFGDHTNCLPF